MGQRHSELSAELHAFIAAQKLFFVATATADSHINLSPKGMDSLRVLGPQRVVWLNLTGSGNETAAHIQADPRMTLMFTALEGKPLILRLYGTARSIHRNDPEWPDLLALFPAQLGARQLFDLHVEWVQTSCGFGVPLYQYVGEREHLTNWAAKQGEAGIEAYWRKQNAVSLEGIPTHIVEKNL